MNKSQDIWLNSTHIGTYHIVNKYTIKVEELGF